MVVYPRWRGEHPRHQLKGEALDGLSPLARGTRWGLMLELYRQRFIPAGAGNTSPYCGFGALNSVYPRWRGEHLIKIQARSLCSGLSPLARGTRILRGFSNFLSRFIPAGAGNTRRPPSARLSTSVYPRWRGEHSAYPHRTS